MAHTYYVDERGDDVTTYVTPLPPDERRAAPTRDVLPGVSRSVISKGARPALKGGRGRIPLHFAQSITKKLARPKKSLAHLPHASIRR